MHLVAGPTTIVVITITTVAVTIVIVASALGSYFRLRFAVTSPPSFAGTEFSSHFVAGFALQ